MWFARALESKTFVKDSFSFSWEKHCLMSNVKKENPPCSHYQQQLEIIMMIMSFQRNSKTSCRSCENILKASFFEMSPRNWLKTTLFEVCKKGADTLCSYHVDHTNNKMNVKTLFTNHFKSCFFQTKACLAWKLLDFLPWSAEHYGTSNCTKDLFNCACNTPNFVFQLL